MMSPEITLGLISSSALSKKVIRYRDLDPWTCFRFADESDQDLHKDHVRIKIDNASYFKPKSGGNRDPLQLSYTSYDEGSVVEVLNAHLTVQFAPEGIN